MTITHGRRTTYIDHGCRCDDCRAAHAAYQRDANDRRALLPFEEIPHGLGGYVNYRCRCETCKDAGAEMNRRNRLRRKEMTQ